MLHLENITFTTPEPLHVLVPRLSNITELNLADDVQVINDDTIGFIAKSCANTLRYLYLTGNPSITDRGLELIPADIIGVGLGPAPLVCICAHTLHTSVLTKNTINRSAKAA